MAKTKHKSDSKFVEHARRELNMCGAFDKNDDTGYNGEMGRGLLALVKVFSEWFGNSKPMAETALDAFNRLLNGEIMSPPTTDPDEWEAVEGAEPGTVRNKRNAFFVSTDFGKTWMHLQNKQRGNSRDRITGEDPTDGIDRRNEQADKHGTGEKDLVPTSTEASAGADNGSSESTAQSDGPGLDPGVAAESQEAPGGSESATEKPKTGEA